MVIEIIGVIIGLIVFILAYLFYDSKNGRKAVYVSSYAGMIDFFAFLSGYIIFTICLILYDNGWPLLIIFPLFISGCLQALMHVAKFLVRIKINKN